MKLVYLLQPYSSYVNGASSRCVNISFILNEDISLCIDSIYSLYYIYFSQYNYITKE